MLFFRKKRYLSWHEYIELIKKISAIKFVSETAEESINNYWEKHEKLSLDQEKIAELFSQQLKNLPIKKEVPK